LAASLRLLYASTPHTLKRRKVYDIAHCHFGQNGILALALRELDLLHARRIITTFHGHDVYVDVPRFSSKLRRLLFENGNAFTVNSSYTLDNVIALGGRKQDICKLPVGLDVDKFEFQPSVRNSGEPVRILTVGRLVEKKGIEYAIRAIAQLKDDFDVMYRIVGGGPLRKQLEQLVGQLGIADDVTFLGALPQAAVREQYQWAHLFTLPSVTASDGDREGQGLVLQEAQVCGLPVVTTRHNGLPDGVKEGESAILVPERDTDALANALQTLVRQESSWPEMGRAGRTFVEENYDIEVLNDRLVSLYRDLLDNDD
jgi:colanic acid/amylovoran biosynthesis glycosyltransferase